MIIRTLTPNSIPGMIVTHPSGSQLFWLKKVDPQVVQEMGLEDQVVEDTSQYFQDFTLPVEWEEGRQYSVGDEIQYGDKYFKVLQAHTAQGDWKPESTPALFTEIDPFNIMDWVMPTGAHDAPSTGDFRTYNGSVWRSKIDGNTTQPGSDDRWWENFGSV